MNSKGKPPRHVYRTGAAGCGGKAAPTNAKNSGTPIPCPFCDRIFKQDGRLKEHLKSKHPDGGAIHDTQEAVLGYAVPAADILPAISIQNDQVSQQSSYPVKTPKTLLHEWCQKNNRPSPKFMHVEIEQGFHCRVILPDARKREADVILWYRDQAAPTSQEAQHRAAIVALHHVLGNRRLDRIIPDEYRQQWYELDAAAEAKEARLKAGIPKLKKQVHAPELQSVYMSESNRRLVEGILKEGSSGSNGAGTGLEDQIHRRCEVEYDNCQTEKISCIFEKERDILQSTSTSNMCTQLSQLGFKDCHIKVALEVANTLSSALDWLVLNVPECDLPVNFAPEASKSSVRVLVRELQGAIINNEGISYLMKYGYPHDGCIAALLKTNGEINLALRKLFEGLIRNQTSDYVGIDYDELNQLREDELIALQSIFEGEEVTFSNALLKILINCPLGHLEMEVHLGNSYPFEIPTITFYSKILHSGLLLQLTQITADYAAQLVGSPMIYELVCFAKDSVVDLIHNYDGGSASQSSKEGLSDNKPILGSIVAKDNKQSLPNGCGKITHERGEMMAYKDAEEDTARLRAEWDHLQNSPQHIKMLSSRQKLPAHSMRNQLIEAIDKNPVTVICGETGCGKSTQVPQYILESWIEKGHNICNILCTQPRRLSAIGLANRVARERGQGVGKTIGYSVRLESCRSRYTRLLFCTTGIVLRRLISDPSLEGVTHVIVDEVHERTVENDLLLLLLKKLLKRSASIRLILMSATLNSSAFAGYFQEIVGHCPMVCHIPGFTFPVKELFLKDVIELTGYKINRKSKYSKGKSSQLLSSMKPVMPTSDVDSWEVQGEQQDFRFFPVTYSELTLQAMAYIDESIINFDLIEALLCTVLQLEMTPSEVYGPLIPRGEEINGLQNNGSFLIFLPGMFEIRRLQVRLQSSKKLAEYGVDGKWVLALHGSLSNEEQSRVFLKPPPGVRKIVLSTNIAETSITIDDILYVIDTGRHKEMAYDHSRSLSCLEDVWISKSNAKQRRGRAGRVQSGCCLRLFSQEKFKEMHEQQLPEVLRVSLEGLCLKIKCLVPGDLITVLSEMLTSPISGSIDMAVKSLQDLNALDGKESLTPLGRHLAQMPVDVRVGKMLIFACMLRCIDPVLTIAAALSGRSPFLSLSDRREETTKVKRSFSDGSKSDHIAIVAAYNGWVYARKQGRVAENDYCAVNFLSKDSLLGIEASRIDYSKLLADLGFISKTSLDGGSANSGNLAGPEPFVINSTSVRVIKAIVCAGFYPNIARIQHPEQTYVQTEAGTVPKPAAAHEIHYFTKPDGRVFLHPSSVNFQVAKYESNWLAYTEKLKTSKIFLKEVSMVPAYSLLLFGGKVSVMHEKQAIAVDDWLVFEAPARIAVLIRELRTKVDFLLLEKIKDPTLDISASSVVTAVIRLLSTDGF